MKNKSKTDPTILIKELDEKMDKEEFYCYVGCFMV